MSAAKRKRSTPGADSAAPVATSDVLCRWLRAGGGAVDGRLAFEAAEGVTATADIPKGTVLLRVPAVLCLGPAAGQQLAPGLAFASVAAALACELSAGLDSSYAAYTTSLPALPNSLLAWTDAEFALLAGTSLADAARGSARESLTAAVRAALPPSAPAFSDDALLRAAAILLTRGFNPGSAGPALVPALDLVRHDSDPAGIGAAVSVATDGAFVLTAVRDLPCGQEVYHSYSSHLSQAGLLRVHGRVAVAPARADAAAAVAPLRVSEVVAFARAAAETRGHAAEMSRDGAASVDAVFDTRCARLRAIGMLPGPDNDLLLVPAPALSSATEFALPRLPREILSPVIALLLPDEAFDDWAAPEATEGDEVATLSLDEDLLVAGGGDMAILALCAFETAMKAIDASKARLQLEPAAADVASLQMGRVAAANAVRTEELGALRQVQALFSMSLRRFKTE